MSLHGRRLDFRVPLAAAALTAGCAMEPAAPPAPEVATEPTKIDLLVGRAATLAETAAIALSEMAPDDPALTAALGEAIRTHIEQCWTIPSFAPGQHGYRVAARLELNREGYLLRPPIVLDRGEAGEDSMQRALRDSAYRAILTCEPYDFLPAESYRHWRSVELIFDPSEAGVVSAP